MCQNHSQQYQYFGLKTFLDLFFTASKKKPFLYFPHTLCPASTLPEEQ